MFTYGCDFFTAAEDKYSPLNGKIIFLWQHESCQKMLTRESTDLRRDVCVYNSDIREKQQGGVWACKGCKVKVHFMILQCYPKCGKNRTYTGLAHQRKDYLHRRILEMFSLDFHGRCILMTRHHSLLTLEVFLPSDPPLQTYHTWPFSELGNVG